MFYHLLRYEDMTIWYYGTKYDTVYVVFEGYIWAIEVDDVHGFIYWGENGQIKRTTLDGSSTKVIVAGGRSKVT